MLLSALIFVATFFFMEGVAWFAHKYVMHGFLWSLHKDHHIRENHDEFLEKNDYFFVIFAVPGMLSIIFSSIYGIAPLMAFGLGITAYGFTYFLMHDVFIHQRLPFLRTSNNVYLRALRRAHKIHHKNIHKHDGSCFGMLLFPYKYFKQELGKSSH